MLKGYHRCIIIYQSSDNNSPRDNRSSYQLFRNYNTRMFASSHLAFHQTSRSLCRSQRGIIRCGILLFLNPSFIRLPNQLYTGTSIPGSSASADITCTPSKISLSQVVAASETANQSNLPSDESPMPPMSSASDASLQRSSNVSPVAIVSIYILPTFIY